MKKIFFALLMAALSACQTQNNSPEAVPVIVGNDSQWKEKTQSSPDGAVVYSEKNMSKTEEESLRRIYSTTDLQNIPVDARHNAQVFAIKNVPEYRDALFIAPKIYAYGSQDGARLAPYKNGNRYILPFPVVLVDGVSRQIQDPRAGKDIQVPAQMLVNDYPGLRSDVERRYFKSTLAPLPGCPRRIVVRIPGKTYDVTPEVMKLSDYCQLNTPFNVEIKTGKDDADYILRKALPEGNVEIMAIYETKVSFAVSRMNLSYDKKRVFQQLEMDLKGGGEMFFQAELKTKITETLKGLSLGIAIKGDYSEQMQVLVDRAFHMFFEPMPEVEKLKHPECQQGRPCFVLSYQEDRYQEELAISWEQSTNAMTGETIAVVSKLRPINDLIVQIGDSRQDGPAQRKSLSNRGSTLETGLTLAQNDELEIEPQFLEVQEQPKQGQKVERQDRRVCAPSEPGVRDGFKPGKCENHWIEYTHYFLPTTANMNRYDNPVGQFEVIFEGLMLKFTFKVEVQGKLENREVTCPLSSFERVGDGRSLKVRIANRPGCEIFGKNQTSPMLHIGNGVHFPASYKEGTVSVDWMGRSLSNVTEKVFFPEVCFGGVLKLKGYGIDSL